MINMRTIALNNQTYAKLKKVKLELSAIEGKELSFDKTVNFLIDELLLGERWKAIEKHRGGI